MTIIFSQSVMKNLNKCELVTLLSIILFVVLLIIQDFYQID
jgi:hypothetical protein